MRKFDWEPLFAALFIPFIFIVALFGIFFSIGPSPVFMHERFKLCIQAGMEWKNNDCVFKKE